MPLICFAHVSEMDIVVVSQEDLHHSVKKLVLSITLISSAAILIMLALFHFFVYRRKKRRSQYLNQSTAAGKINDFNLIDYEVALFAISISTTFDIYNLF